MTNVYWERCIDLNHHFPRCLSRKKAGTWNRNRKQFCLRKHPGDWYGLGPLWTFSTHGGRQSKDVCSTWFLREKNWGSVHKGIPFLYITIFTRLGCILSFWVTPISFFILLFGVRSSKNWNNNYQSIYLSIDSTIELSLYRVCFSKDNSAENCSLEHVQTACWLTRCFHFYQYFSYHLVTPEFLKVFWKIVLYF